MQLALLVDLRENRCLARHQLGQIGAALGDRRDLDFAQSTGRFFAIPGDKRQRRAFIE